MAASRVAHRSGSFPTESCNQEGDRSSVRQELCGSFRTMSPLRTALFRKIPRTPVSSSLSKRRRFWGSACKRLHSSESFSCCFPSSSAMSSESSSLNMSETTSVPSVSLFLLLSSSMLSPTSAIRGDTTEEWRRLFPLDRVDAGGADADGFLRRPSPTISGFRFCVEGPITHARAHLLSSDEGDQAVVVASRKRNAPRLRVIVLEATGIGAYRVLLFCVCLVVKPSSACDMETDCSLPKPRK
mmetsp:Transcript_36507/g.76632  ORF Transcript_36507/g.76632 Transcript_36507/m.76632 type:complete len:242 (+) Transcript_36507:2925-3650(+)